MEVALETADAVTDARRLWAVLKVALWAMVGRRGEEEGGGIKGGGPLGSTCEDSESADYLYSWAGNGPTETIRALGRGRRAASGL